MFVLLRGQTDRFWAIRAIFLSWDFALTIGVFILFTGVMVFLSATLLRSGFEYVLFRQQFATAQHIAADIDSKLKECIQGLSMVAALAWRRLGVEVVVQFGGQHALGQALLELAGQARFTQNELRILVLDLRQHIAEHHRSLQFKPAAQFTWLCHVCLVCDSISIFNLGLYSAL